MLIIAMQVTNKIPHLVEWKPFAKCEDLVAIHVVDIWLRKHRFASRVEHNVPVHMVSRGMLALA